MNQNVLLIGLLIGALFFLRRPTRSEDTEGPWIFPTGGAGTGDSQAPWTGGAGTGYGIDIWGDEG